MCLATSLGPTLRSLLHDPLRPTQICKSGSRVFYVHPTLGWQIGTVQEYGKKVHINGVDDDGRPGQVVTVLPTEIHPHTEGSYDKRLDDLFQMGDLHQATLLHCLKERYEKDRMMYTRMGEIIISINPFGPRDYNNPTKMGPHTEGKWECPHTWEVAHKAYKKIVVMDKRNQSILISGESGAGKTETAKTLIDYLGRMSASHSCNNVQRGIAESVNKKLKASNPILESFGNAKTLRNDNSSRFGKYIKLFFDKASGILVGAEMVHYLLEKSRIVTQNEGERGYHVFYEMLAGFSPEQKKKYGNLTRPQDYDMLSKGNQYVREMNGHVTDDRQMFQELVQAFQDSSITAQEQDDIFSVLGAILNLQNVKFVLDESSGKAKIGNPALVDTVSSLLKVDAARFKEAILVKSKTKIMTQMADVPEAMDMRDALTKALYSGVFDWLVTKLNKVIAPDQSTAPMGRETRYVGLLDIFGFENFKINSFEQFCINFTNESLQNHYNKYTFVMDSEECKAEGIQCPIVDYPDNQPCLDMLQSKRGGVMSQLDDECHFKLGTDNTFTEKSWAVHGENKYFVKPRSTRPDRFGVNHYAATVTYMTEGWREKNMDTLKDSVRTCVNDSSNAFAAGLLGPVIDEGKGLKKPTVGSNFKNQLEALKEELNSTDSHFVRTVKPNPHMNKKGVLVDNDYVMKQLTAAGVIETIIMKRQGYPVRQLHKDFWLRYRIIAPKALKKRYPPGVHPKDGEELKKACHDIAAFWSGLLFAPKPNFDIGHTKVFSKARVSEGLEVHRNKKIRRLLPRCFPFLIRWAQAFKKRKAAEAERRRNAQEAMAKSAEEAAAGRARGDVATNAQGMAREKGQTFQHMCDLFPHFDLPVILNIVENAPTREVAMNFLLEIQQQHVANALPLTVKQLFDEAQLRPATQEELIRKGVTQRDKLYALTPVCTADGCASTTRTHTHTHTQEEMSALGFSVEERDRLAKVLLHQQGDWVINQRLNLLMGTQDSGAMRMCTLLLCLRAFG